MATSFAKLDANFFSNVKARKAGPEGRMVFVFMLCKVAQLDNDGWVPLQNGEDWYLAEQLGVTKSHASDGLRHAVTAGLLTVTDDKIVLNGWDDGWSKKAKTHADRQAAYREKQREKTLARDESDGPKVTRDGSDAREEKRREENITTRRKRAEAKEASPEASRAAHILAGLIQARDPGAKVKPDGWCDDLEKLHRIDGRSWEQICDVIEWCQRDEFWAPNILSGKKLRAQFTALVAKMTKRSGSLQPGQRAGNGLQEVTMEDFR